LPTVVTETNSKPWTFNWFDVFHLSLLLQVKRVNHSLYNCPQMIWSHY